MSRTILVVDDLPQNRDLMRALLEGHGHDVIEAEGGREALTLARSQPLDAVITDLLMPGMDGFTLCREWNQDPALRQIPLIVYTASFTGPQDRQLAIDLGAAAYILKPAEPEVLANAVISAIERSEVPPPEDPAPTEAVFAERYAQQLKAKLDHKIERLATMERELASYVARCEALLDSLPQAVILCDQRRSIRFWSYQATQLLGQVDQDVAARDLTELVAEEQQEELLELLETARQKGRASADAIRWRHESGAMVEASVAVTFFGEPIGYGCLLTDLSAEREAAEEKRRWEAQVAQVERLATLGTVAAGVAHEINNPLMHIRHCLDTLAEDLASEAPPEDEKLAETVSEARASTNRIYAITRGLSAFSRVEDDDVGPLNLHDCLDAAATMARAQLKHRGKLERDYGDLPVVRATPGRLSQVFLNLLVNAAQALDQRSAIENVVKVTTRAGADQVTVTIRDTGEGIAPDALERVFDPFFSTKAYGKGSGLGLAISKRIIESFGGRIEVESELGVGTTFTVVLPTARHDVAG